jgi:hypothetical protein
MIRTSRPPSLGSRIRGVLPVLAVFGATIVAVYASMTVLSAIPYNPTLTPQPSGVGPSYAPDESDWSAYSIEASPTPVPTPKVTASLPVDPPEVIAMIASASEKGIWTASLKYPRFRPETTPWADAMNEDLRNEAEDRIARYSIGTAAVKTPGKINTLTGGFDIELLTPALASFTLFWTDSTFKSEETPALEQIETVNLDLGTGVRISLSDLFSNRASALSILSTRSRELLREQLGDDYNAAVVTEGTQIDFDDGTDTGVTVRDGRNFPNWVLTRAGLRITWLEGQVAPEEVGKVSVLIPWAEFAGVLDPTFPVAALAR